MNPETNKFELLEEVEDDKGLLKKYEEFQKAMNNPSKEFAYKKLLRPNGEPVPDHWTILRVNEKVLIKGYAFKVAHIGESHLLLEPAGPIVLEEEK